MFSSLKTLLRDNAALNARVVELERQLATERSRFDWLSMHVNELKTERALLLERVLGLTVPVMTVEREESAPAPVPTREVIDPAKLREQVAYAPAPQGSPGRVFRPTEDTSAQIREAIEAGTLFEDVGDDRARRIGVGWDAEGNAVPVFAGSREE